MRLGKEPSLEYIFTFASLAFLWHIEDTYNVSLSLSFLVIIIKTVVGCSPNQPCTFALLFSSFQIEHILESLCFLTSRKN